MARHIATGVAAVVENGHQTGPNTVWVNSSDVSKALTAIGKLSGERFPEATVFKRVDRDTPRVCIEL